MGNIVNSIHHRIIKAEVIPTPPLRNLTESQVDIVKCTWEIPSEKPHDFGEKILLLYFERYPHNQQKFAAFRNTPLIVLKGEDNQPRLLTVIQSLIKIISGTPGFRSHANKIMSIFSTAIDCLGKQGGLEEIVKILNEMGKNHRRRGISKKAFIELRVIIIEMLLQDCHLDDEGADAWNCLLDTVYHVIFGNLQENNLFNSS